MKKLLSLLLVASFVCLSIAALADGPPPPPGNPSTGGGGTPVGAPIDAGVIVLLALGAAYGGSKLYLNHKKKPVAEN